MKQRTIMKVMSGKKTSDGAGVSLVRSLGTAQLSVFDPFLLLDEFGSDNPNDYIGGFPSHPHRSFETVTYMLSGLVEHEDSHGHKGLLRSGGVQWMTAGRGIVHSEMPRQKDGLLRGFQLWVNLPASEKMRKPRYQNIEPEEVPTVKRADGTLIKVIAGEADGAVGPAKGIVTDPLYIDVTLPPNVAYSHGVLKGHNGFAYLFEGGAEVCGQNVKASALVAFNDDGDEVALKSGPNGARFLLISARKLNEPVARYGPFVMNTDEELQQAFDDYRNGRF